MQTAEGEVFIMTKIDRETLRDMLYAQNMALGKPELYAIARSLGVSVTKGMTWNELFDRVYDGVDYQKLVQAIVVEARSAFRYCPEESKHKLANLIRALTDEG